MLLGWAQRATPLVGKIRGILEDSLQKTPLAYATVTLKKEGKVITGALTGEKGEFVLQNVPVGRYTLEASYIGFATKILSIQTKPEKPDKNLGILYLMPSDLILQEVEIQAQKPVYEYNVEKITFNVTQDITSQMGDATNVLQKVPSVQVDMDGNVYVRGSSNVRILINGKPSLLMNENAAEALRSLSADQIEKVELITSPSAKYQGEGAAILNIVLKKSLLDGTAGNLSGGAGSLMANLSALFMIRKNRWSHSVNTGGRYRYAGNGISSFYRWDSVAGGVRELSQEGSFIPRRGSTNLNYTVEYQANAYNTLSLSTNVQGLIFRRYTTLAVELQEPSLYLSYNRDTYNPTRKIGGGFNLDWQRKSPKKPEAELFMSLQGGYSHTENLYTLSQPVSVEAFSRQEKSQNFSTTPELQYQLDYTYPLSPNLKLETGFRMETRFLRTTFSYEVFDKRLGEYRFDSLRSDELEYDQLIPAGYGQLLYKTTRWLFRAGVRYEKTLNKASFLRGSLPFSQAYDNLLPTATIGYTWGLMRGIQVSYNQRIRRPWISQLNPFIDASDPRNVSYGNPNLLPERTHNFELGLQPLVTFFWRHTPNVIQSYSFIDAEGVTRNTFTNAGIENAWGADIFLRRNVWKDKLTLMLNGTLSWQEQRAEIEGVRYQNQGFVWRAGGSIQLRPVKSWAMEASGFVASRRITLQGYAPVMSFAQVALRKSFLEDRLYVGLFVQNPWQTYLNFATKTEARTFYQLSETKVPFRFVGVQAQYRWGSFGGNRRNRRMEENREPPDML
ncbi:MAG: outer membrane beta-barrel protein [Bacteroidia bacterium]